MYPDNYYINVACILKNSSFRSSKMTMSTNSFQLSHSFLSVSISDFIIISHGAETMISNAVTCSHKISSSTAQILGNSSFQYIEMPQLFRFQTSVVF